MYAGERLNLLALLDLSPAPGENLGPPWRRQNAAGRSPHEVTKRPVELQSQALMCSVAWVVRGFSSSGRSSSSCIMIQARWALTLILLLVALPAEDVGAAPWRAQAVGR